MTISTAVCNTATVAAKPLTGGDTHRHGQTEAALEDVQDRGDRQDAGGFLRGREGAAVPHAMDFQGSTLLSEKGFPQQPQREDRATRGAGSDSQRRLPQREAVPRRRKPRGSDWLQFHGTRSHCSRAMAG